MSSEDVGESRERLRGGGLGGLTGCSGDLTECLLINRITVNFVLSFVAFKILFCQFTQKYLDSENDSK